MTKVTVTTPDVREEALYPVLLALLDRFPFASEAEFGMRESANSIDYARLRLRAYPLVLIAQHAGRGFFVHHGCSTCGRRMTLDPQVRQGIVAHLCEQCGPQSFRFGSLILDEGREHRRVEALAADLLHTGATDPLTATVDASEITEFLMAWRAAYWELA